MTGESNAPAIRAGVLELWRLHLGPVEKHSESIFRVGGKRVNLRTATRKRGDAFWFDVTPRFYEDREVDFFAYACGSASHVYLIPAPELGRLVRNASSSRSRYAPNFTIHLDAHELEPAGAGGQRLSLQPYYNRHELLSR